jgi:hypothetical protein
MKVPHTIYTKLNARGKCPFPAPESDGGEGEGAWPCSEDSLAAVTGGSGFIERKVNMQGCQGDLESRRMLRCLLQSSAIGNSAYRPSLSQQSIQFQDMNRTYSQGQHVSRSKSKTERKLLSGAGGIERQVVRGRPYHRSI